MPPPSSQALQELGRLDTSSFDFYTRLDSIHKENFEHDDLVWLIDRLDEVCRDVASLFLSPLKPA